MPREIKINEKIRALRAFYRTEQRPPSYRELLTVWGYRSKHAVHNVIRKLEEGGWVVRRENRLGLTDKLTGSLRLLGTVQAGFPSPAEEELADTLSLDEYLVRHPEATYMLTVTGDSMIEAGILPGDIVLVEKGGKPRKNDIVIAQVDDEWTIKYYVEDAAGVRLDPANPKYRFIRPRRSLNIGGVVKGVVRRYN